MTDRPHSLLVEHVRLRDTHGLIGLRPGCLACAEQFGPDYATRPYAPQTRGESR